MARCCPSPRRRPARRRERALMRGARVPGWGRVAPALCALALAPAAASAEPRLTVPQSRMDGALTCYGPVGRAAPQPILFAPGTGSDASQVFLLGGGAFAAMGR